MRSSSGEASQRSRTGARASGLRLLIHNLLLAPTPALDDYLHFSDRVACEEAVVRPAKLELVRHDDRFDDDRAAGADVATIPLEAHEGRGIGVDIPASVFDTDAYLSRLYCATAFITTALSSRSLSDAYSRARPFCATDILTSASFRSSSKRIRASA